MTDRVSAPWPTIPVWVLAVDTPLICQIHAESALHKIYTTCFWLELAVIFLKMNQKEIRCQSAAALLGGTVASYSADESIYYSYAAYGRQLILCI